MHPSDLQGCRDTSSYESGRDEILGDLSVEIECAASNSKRGRNDGTDHGKCVLQTQKEGK